MPYFHPMEEFQVWVVVGYEDDHPNTRYLVEFADGESYRCTFADTYNSGNWPELDKLGADYDDPRFDEFQDLVFQILEPTVGGTRRYNEYLTVNYRDFPAKITDVDTGTVIYQET